MGKKVSVVCRCGQVCRSFDDFDKHLTKRHPKWRKELEESGQLAEDRAVFRKARSK